jgi:hypothetical protein
MNPQSFLTNKKLLTVLKLAPCITLLVLSNLSAVGTTRVHDKTHLPVTDSTAFKAEKVSQTDSIFLNGNIKEVFPLFGAFKERKWAEEWNPTLLYMSADTIEEGTTFKTKGHGHGETEFIWRINKYDSKGHIIQYLVMSPNRYWTITVKCTKMAKTKTMAQITYTFIGLNELGNHIDKHFLTIIYEHHLKDWEQAINSFLDKEKSKQGNS